MELAEASASASRSAIMKALDVSIVMVLREEGRKAHPAVVSALKAIDRAKRAVIDGELLLVLDRAEDSTRRYVERHRHDPRIRVVVVNCGDVGMARNKGIAQAAGHWVTIMTPMHRVCDNWITDAVGALRADPVQRIVRPEYLVVVGVQNWVQRLTTSSATEFPMGSLLIEHVYRTGFCCASKSIFEWMGYPSVQDCMEEETMDWYWTCETLAARIEHMVVPETVLFVQDPDGGSIENRSNEGRTVLLQTSKLFEPTRWKSMAG